MWAVPTCPLPEGDAAGITQTMVRHPIDMITPYMSAEEKEDVAAVSPDAKFAIIGLSGTQFKVALDDLVVADLIHDYDIGESFDISDVLLVGTQNYTAVGRPRVVGATVTLEVEEHTKDKKVIIFKKKRRKTYERKTGFRRCVTLLRVTAINHDE